MNLTAPGARKPVRNKTEPRTMTATKNDVQILCDAAQLIRDDSYCDGSLLDFPDFGQVVMTGDMHGHHRNFEKLVKYADLDHARARHVILHELIHAEHSGPIGNDDSIELIVRAARWKTQFPDQVHFLQSNHEMAQYTGKDIIKGGRIVNYDFDCSLQRIYGNGADDVRDALREFIASFPLAARTPNRIFLSHSLPNITDLGTFDPNVLRRPLGGKDLVEGGDAYAMVWGRRHPPKLLDKLARDFDVDFFICGHQPQESGAAVLNDRQIILASDHNHGTFLPFDLKKPYTIKTLTRLIRPFAAIA